MPPIADSIVSAVGKQGVVIAVQLKVHEEDTRSQIDSFYIHRISQALEMLFALELDKNLRVWISKFGCFKKDI